MLLSCCRALKIGVHSSCLSGVVVHGQIGTSGPLSAHGLRKSVCRHLGRLRNFTTMKQYCMDIRCTDISNRRHGAENEGFMDKTLFIYPFINFYGMGLKSSACVLWVPDGFVGLVPTRSVAESVFVSQLLRTIREANLDIDSIAEHLHRTKAPTAPVPSKQEAPVDFISPVVVSVVDLIETNSTGTPR